MANTKNELEKARTDVSLTRPAFIPAGDVSGTEGIDKKDMLLPRLALCQGTSKQLKDADPRYIDGLKLGDMFNSLTGQIFGKGPIEFVVLRVDRPRWVEFNPLSAGGGMKDPNVPPNDPRTLFGPDGEQPTATQFYDFIALALPVDMDNPMANVIGLSFKSTQIKAAKLLNFFIKFKTAPVYSCVYSIVSGDEKNAKGEWKGYVVKQVGFIADEGLLTLAKGMFEALGDAKVAIDVEHEPEPVVSEAAEPADGGDPSFDPRGM